MKVLAKGELSKSLTVHAHAFSASARERIEAAGGSCKILERLTRPRGARTAARLDRRIH